MAKFDILEQEGMRFVRMAIQDEMVRAEAGALAFMRGPIMMDAPIPSIGGALKAMLSEQAIVRPKYTGTGQVILEPSVGGSHLRMRRRGLDPRAGRLLVLGRQR
jgi:uncharacterized protein (AIM24 family)